MVLCVQVSCVNGGFFKKNNGTIKGRRRRGEQRKIIMCGVAIFFGVLKWYGIYVFAPKV